VIERGEFDGGRCRCGYGPIRFYSDYFKIATSFAQEVALGVDCAVLAVIIAT